MNERCQSCQGALTTAYEKERGAHQRCETPTKPEVYQWIKSAGEDCADWVAYQIAELSEAARGSLAQKFAAILAAHAPQQWIPLRELFQLVEDGLLVRSAKNDGDFRKFTEESMRIVEVLSAASKALAAPPVPANKETK